MPDDIRYQKLALTLKAWGIGLFEGVCPLDIILVSDYERYDILREYLLQAFMHIAVTQGRHPSVLRYSSIVKLM